MSRIRIAALACAAGISASLVLPGGAIITSGDLQALVAAEQS
jgi:hypothetical protein